MISAQRLEWQGLDTLNFDLITDLAFDEDNGATSSFLNQEGIYTEHYDGHRTIHRVKTNEFFSPTFTLIKNDFGDFTMEENRRILSWLSTEKPGWLNVYHDDSNVLSYRCFGTWESIELYKLGNGRIVGYIISFASTHPYAWSREFIYPTVYDTIEEGSINDETNDYLTVNGVKTFTITCNTDEYNKPIYPKIVVNFKGNKDIYIPVDKQPKDNEYMIPNAIYTYQDENDNPRFYVSIKTEDVAIRTEILPTSADSQLDVLYTESSNNYFFVKDGEFYTIRQIVVNDQKNGYEWKLITKTGAALAIKNTYILNGETVNKEATIKGAALDEEITLDGTNKVISVTRNGTIDDRVRIIGDDFNWEWLPLIYGDNNITIYGNCNVQIRWIEPRKIGSL